MFVLLYSYIAFPNPTCSIWASDAWTCTIFWISDKRIQMSFSQKAKEYWFLCIDRNIISSEQAALFYKQKVLQIITCLSWQLSPLWYGNSKAWYQSHQLFFSFINFIKKKRNSDIHPSYLKLTLHRDEFHLSPFPHHMMTPLHCTSSVPIWAQLPIPPEHTFWYTLTHTHASSHWHLDPHSNIQPSITRYTKWKMNTSEWKCTGNQSSREWGGVSSLLGANHHFGDKIDDSSAWLVRIQLCKQVADIICCASLLPGHKTKKPAMKEETCSFRTIPFT